VRSRGALPSSAAAGTAVLVLLLLLLLLHLFVALLALLECIIAFATHAHFVVLRGGTRLGGRTGRGARRDRSAIFAAVVAMDAAAAAAVMAARQQAEADAAVVATNGRTVQLPLVRGRAEWGRETVLLLLCCSFLCCRPPWHSEVSDAVGGLQLREGRAMQPQTDERTHSETSNQRRQEREHAGREQRHRASRFPPPVPACSFAAATRPSPSAAARLWPGRSRVSAASARVFLAVS
jgi:hypothetical protein